ncbi:MAG: hypothetical protein KGL95_08740, partial [Patescibacteria group bacterium]|nr:hypothetical protein [Patescibacteria group bacterium]
MVDEFRNFVRKIYYNFPILRPYMAFANRMNSIINPRFAGWGMRTNRELPWIDDYGGVIFRQVAIDVKKNFEFNRDITDIHRNNIDSLLWRHWVVSYATRHAIEFAHTNE